MIHTKKTLPLPLKQRMQKIGKSSRDLSHGRTEILIEIL